MEESSTEASTSRPAEPMLLVDAAQLEAITNSIEQMIWSTRPDGFHDFYNQRWYEYTGVPAGTTDGEAWNDMFHPDDQQRAWAIWRHSLATGDPYYIEYRLRHWSGQYRWVLGRAHAAKDESGRIIRWYGTCTDIQDIIEAREVLARSREELEHLVERRTLERDSAWKYSRDLQVVVGSDGIIRAANQAWLTILGWEPARVVGRHHRALSVVEDRAASEQAFRIATREPLDPFEHRAVHKDGSFRWLSWVAAREGELVYASGRDITAEKQAAIALHDTQEQLRQAQKMEAVGQLTGGLAHDFNNLLMGISGSLELLQRKLEQGRIAEAERHVAAAQNASRRASSLTHRLLAFSRRQTLDPKPVDIARLALNMEELIRRTIGPGIDFERVAPPESWLALVDANQLENAVLNLCINARDAMPNGGRLTIETAHLQLDERSARDLDLAPGPYLSLCVTDTGSGMPPDVVDRAFDPFFTTKPLGLGTGLGLSMVYGFARQSAGQVRIDSEVDRGTSICLYLPRSEGVAAGPDEAQRPALAPQAASAATVLVVDDEAIVRSLVAEVLVERGYQALEAADGTEGLAILQSNRRVDLLITDVGLPGGMNGRQLADAARVRRPALTVLFITGYAESAIMGNGHLDHDMHVLTKPFSLETLAARIDEFIKPAGP